MINPVNNNLGLIPTRDIKESISNDKTDQTKSFVDMLKDNIDNTNDLINQSEELSKDFALGKIDNIHEVTIASEKASVALNLTLAVQSKVVDAYKEIMRMQI
mgnify:CR=1 FL=1